MKTLKTRFCLLAVVVIGTMVGCATTSTKTAAVSDTIRASLDEAGLKNVKVSQDRDKGVVTLGGNVASESEKSKAASIAAAVAGPQVVANEVAVIPPGNENDAKKINMGLDKAIEGNLDAALIKDKLHDSVKYSVKNLVVTLTGNVDSQAKRARAEQIAAAVYNVRQVVNELQVKEQKATSSN